MSRGLRPLVRHGHGRVLTMARAIWGAVVGLASIIALVGASQPRKALLSHGSKSNEKVDLRSKADQEVAEENLKGYMKDEGMDALVKSLTGKSVPVVGRHKAEVKEVLRRAIKSGNWESARDTLFAKRHTYFGAFAPKYQDRNYKQLVKGFGENVDAWRKHWRQCE